MEKAPETHKWIDASVYGLRFYAASVEGLSNAVTFVVLEEARNVAAREGVFEALGQIGYRWIDVYDAAWRPGSDIPLEELRTKFPDIEIVDMPRQAFVRRLTSGPGSSDMGKCLHDAITWRPSSNTGSHRDAGRRTRSMTSSPSGSSPEDIAHKVSNSFSMGFTG